MINPIHLIQVELGEQPRIVFGDDYRPATGPLPKQIYPLVSLWSYEGLLVRAIFEARVVPVHEHEPIFHRYEGPMIAHPGQASYRYFTVPGYAGMTLTEKGFAKAGVPLEAVWGSLSQAANAAAVQKWTAEYNAQDPLPPTKPVLTVLKDQLANLPDLILYLRPEERTDNP